MYGWHVECGPTPGQLRASDALVFSVLTMNPGEKMAVCSGARVGILAHRPPYPATGMTIGGFANARCGGGYARRGPENASIAAAKKVNVWTVYQS